MTNFQVRALALLFIISIATLIILVNIKGF